MAACPAEGDMFVASRAVAETAGADDRLHAGRFAAGNGGRWLHFLCGSRAR
jgi:hypothetical protein